jgi:tetratricopeptide (TPR) repeat protein
VWPRTTISADRGGVAAGRDAIVGISPEQLPAIIAAAIDPLKKITDEQQAVIGELQKRLGANESQLQTFFHIIGEAGVAPEQVGERLYEIATRYQQLLIQVEARPEDEPEVARLRAEAREALETGDFDRADALLSKVEQLQEAALDRRALEAAATRVQRGEIALTRLRYREAASHFAAAAERVPPAHEDERLDCLDRAANALYRQGDQFGDNAALVESIARYRALLERRPRERVSLDWAATQTNLGRALARLGERESGTERLEQALAAFHAALEEYTRERAPLPWALAQTNLGLVLTMLGERESSTRRLEEAVAAFREALKERTRERVPLDWAATRTNLGNALLRLGERESGTERLEQALAAYRAALEEYTRERAPLQWAMIQTNLGLVLTLLGERESSTRRLEEAVAAFGAALKERTRERVPLDWAATQTNLGRALARLGHRTRDRSELKEARNAIEAAFDLFMEAGQEQHRLYFEDLLIEIDGKIADLTMHPRA